MTLPRESDWDEWPDDGGQYLPPPTFRMDRGGPTVADETGRRDREAKAIVDAEEAQRSAGLPIRRVMFSACTYFGHAHCCREYAHSTYRAVCKCACHQDLSA